LVREEAGADSRHKEISTLWPLLNGVWFIMKVAFSSPNLHALTNPFFIDRIQALSNWSHQTLQNSALEFFSFQVFLSHRNDLVAFC
jgi:hypothetical protein